MRRLSKAKTYDQLEHDYEAIRKRNKFLKRRALILAVFVFVVNAYAWFVYISEADVRTDAAVKNWDLNFYDGTTAIKEVVINPEMFPGMPEFTKSINIINASDVKADVEYKIKDVTLAGLPMFPTNTSDADIIDIVTDGYPFKVTISSGKDTLDETDSAPFTVKINWKYEDSSEYYKVGYSFNYGDDYQYYTYSECNYTLDTTVNATNWASKKDTLFMQKDDIDSYLGTVCGNYQRTNNTNCLKFTVAITAKQQGT